MLVRDWEHPETKSLPTIEEVSSDTAWQLWEHEKELFRV